MTRRESVAGSFYPAHEEDEKRYFERFNEILKRHNVKLPNITPKAVIVPHAGHIYSGFTANIAYRLLRQSALSCFVIIGPSHRVAFEGSSMCAFTSYATPFGPLLWDEAMYEELARRFDLACLAQAHAEHSTEVQFPFIKYYMPDARIIEIVYGREDPKRLASIIEFVLAKEGWGVIISTDLSHFYTLEEAKRLDAICIEAIEHLDYELLHRGCEACGKIGVEAMLLAAKDKGLIPYILDYRTSADASGDSSRVVGYLSVAFRGA